MANDKLAKYRKKPSLRIREAYRPTEYYASVSEAKEIFRERYRKLGYKVKTVRRRDWHFTVSFGEDKNGIGKGPRGLSSIICNWPHRKGFNTTEQVTKWLIKKNIIRTPKKTKKARKRSRIRKGKTK